MFWLLTFISFIISLVLTRWLLSYNQSKVFNTRTIPQQERWASARKPDTGGISLFISFLVIAIFLVFWEPNEIDTQYLGLVLSSTCGFMLGLWDDRYHISPKFKFIGQLICAHLLFFSGYHIDLVSVPVINYLFTVTWVLGIMNSINMLDNMDGISTIAALTALLACAITLYINESYFSPIMIIGLSCIGGLMGFLYYNWHPSKLYMGDSGSQFLGIILSALAILCLWPIRDDAGGFQIKQFVFPLIAFMIPIIDTTTVTIRRISNGKTPFEGGRDHTTHQIALYSKSDRFVAYLMIGISLINIVLFYNLLSLTNQWKFSNTVFVIAYFLLLFGFFQWFYFANNRQKN